MSTPQQAIAQIAQAQQLFLQGSLHAARAVLSPLLQTHPEHVDALQVLGLIAQQEGEIEQAIASLMRAAELAPKRGDVQANIGNLLRAVERCEAALAYLERAVKLAPNEALIHINLGLLLQDMQQLPAAEAAFRRALALQPQLAAAHQSLGHLLLQTDLAQARQHLIRALQLSPGLHTAFKDLCTALIAMGEPEPALALCTARLHKVPSDQDALAIKALALRELGHDDQANALLDCDIWLKSYAQEPPPGFACMSDFNAALLAHVQAHPKLTTILFAQATHHGKRVNDLLAPPKGPVNLLEMMMHKALQRYRDELPRHNGLAPFAQPPTGQSHLRSWAVLMEQHGHETPHIHPDGRISGVYYVHLPDVVVQNDGSCAGWIEFGMPDPLFAARRPVPTRKVQPVEGTMLLFPSYFWHRTIAFDTPEHRLSIAFDSH